MSFFACSSQTWSWFEDLWDSWEIYVAPVFCFGITLDVLGHVCVVVVRGGAAGSWVRWATIEVVGCSLITFGVVLDYIWCHWVSLEPRWFACNSNHHLDQGTFNEHPSMFFKESGTTYKTHTWPNLHVYGDYSSAHICDACSTLDIWTILVVGRYVLN